LETDSVRGSFSFGVVEMSRGAWEKKCGKAVQIRREKERMRQDPLFAGRRGEKKSGMGGKETLTEDGGQNWVRWRSTRGVGIIIKKAAKSSKLKGRGISIASSLIGNQSPNSCSAKRTRRKTSWNVGVR